MYEDIKIFLKVCIYSLSWIVLLMENITKGTSKHNIIFKNKIKIGFEK